MKYDFLNPCQAVRDYFAMTYGVSVDYNLIPKMLEDLEMLKIEDYEKYKTVISVLYTDYYVFNYINRYKFRDEDSIDYDENFIINKNVFDSFTSADDVISYLEIDPRLLIDMLYDSFSLDELSPLEKRQILNYTKDIDKYLFNINRFHFIDKLYYCYEYDKDELLIKYNEYITKNIEKFSDLDIETLRIDACDFIEDFLIDLEEFDYHNYRRLVMSVVRDSYIYNKYIVDNKGNSQLSKDLVDTIEQNSIKEIIDLTRNDDCFLNDSLRSFFEFNFQQEAYRDKMTNEVFINSSSNIKRKILGKPTK